jgi:formamidopyrimidine-DNA glycosylase
MPELPDVELMSRRLQRTALRKPITGVAVRDARILAGVDAKAFAAALRGRRFERALRRGKHLLVTLDDGRWLTLHFGMTGDLVAFAADAEEPKFTRVCFDFADGNHLAYTSRRILGRVGLAEDAAAFIAAENLGSDALDLDRDAFDRILERRKGAVKGLLMDQAALAGIGNIYSDEILFQARLHPQTPVDRLAAKARTRLYRAMREVLETAIAVEAGSEHGAERLPRGYLLPQRQKGGRCPACGGALDTVKVGGRTGYYCPHCQPTSA